jgi:hypothetical protein
MKNMLPLSRKTLRSASITCVVLFAAMSVVTHEFNKLKRIDTKIMVQPRISQKFKQSNTNSSSCAHSSNNAKPNNNLAAIVGPKACSSVQGCNELIANCISAGGVFYPDGHDPDSGAPSSGTCVTSSC